MMVVDRFTDSFNEHAENLRAERELAERKDYGAALSDSDIGRLRKHILGNDINPLTGKKKKDAIAEALQKTLEDMLLNPQYRLAHENLIKTTRETVTQAGNVLEDIRARLNQAHSDMDILLSKAARLHDGRAVFKFADGRVEDENGNIIDDALTSHITWHDDMPSGEDYRNHRQHINSLEAAERELRGIEAELGDIHERNTRNNDPLSLEDKNKDIERVKEIGERIQKIDDNLENRVDKKSFDGNNDETLDIEKKDLTSLPVIKIGN